MRVLAPCGTEAAYRRHLRGREEPCAECRRANAAVVAERNSQPENIEKMRAAARRVSQRRKAERAARRPSDLDRLMRSIVKAENGCWHWTGGVAAENGYGRAWLKGATRSAHVAMFMVTKGSVPAGFEVDHTCHNADRSCAGGPECMHRRCVNPDHLGAVSKSANQVRQGRRKTHCPRGHEYTPENTRISKGNCRSCRRCHTERAREARAAA